MKYFIITYIIIWVVLFGYLTYILKKIHKMKNELKSIEEQRLSHNEDEIAEKNIERRDL